MQKNDERVEDIDGLTEFSFCDVLLNTKYAISKMLLSWLSLIKQNPM